MNIIGVVVMFMDLPYVTTDVFFLLEVVVATTPLHIFTVHTSFLDLGVTG